MNALSSKNPNKSSELEQPVALNDERGKEGTRRTVRDVLMPVLKERMAKIMPAMSDCQCPKNDKPCGTLAPHTPNDHEPGQRVRAKEPARGSQPAARIPGPPKRAIATSVTVQKQQPLKARITMALPNKAGDDDDATSGKSLVEPSLTETASGTDQSATIPGVNKTKAEFWLLRIKAVLVKTTDSVIEAGAILIQAKEDLDRHGEWLSMFKDKRLPFSERVAEYLMQIARHPVISNPNNRSVLPLARTALIELVKGDDLKVVEAIHDGKVHPAMTAKEVRMLVGGAPAKHGEEEEKRCDRRLAAIGKYVQEANSWSDMSRTRFVTELKKIVESIA